MDGAFVAGEIAEMGDPWQRCTDRLGFVIGRAVAKLLHEIPQEQIFAPTLFAHADVGKDQARQIVRAIPPGRRKIAGEIFAPAREDHRRLVKIPIVGLGR
jgi:hypothetical protein